MSPKKQSGFAAIYLTVLILAVSLTLTAGIFVLTSVQQKDIQNIIQSSQSYFLAEAGLEDAILRIKNSMPISANYIMSVDTGQAIVSIASPNPNTRIIRAKGTKGDVSKTLEVQLSIQTINPDFFYGAQAGTLGIVMENNSRIEGTLGQAGNIYSNGPVEGSEQGGNSVITGTVLVANGSLKDVTVLGDAHANTITSSKICGNAYYQTIDADSLDFLNDPSNPTCQDPLTPGTAHPESSDPPLQNMPISDSNINQWKAEAVEGGVLNGNLTVSSNLSYGPKEIEGNIIMTSNNKILTVEGTIHATGYLDVSNGSAIRCSPSYGLNSCIVIVDQWAHFENNGIFQGSGQGGSYIMILSTSDCDGTFSANCTHHNAAMDLHNGATGAIFYANDGFIYLHNGVVVSELTAKKIQLNQGAVIRYEQGLINSSFSSGPGGSWKVESWKEVE